MKTINVFNSSEGRGPGIIIPDTAPHKSVVDAVIYVPSDEDVKSFTDLAKSYRVGTTGSQSNFKAHCVMDDDTFAYFLLRYS